MYAAAICEKSWERWRVRKYRNITGAELARVRAHVEALDKAVTLLVYPEPIVGIDRRIRADLEEVRFDLTSDGEAPGTFRRTETGRELVVC